MFWGCLQVTPCVNASIPGVNFSAVPDRCVPGRYEVFESGAE